ncbi:MAG TPA: zinc-binding dehydrogenase, partial [Agromyces mariniharenae]|nr:zinc-binding dehydrogenase [Agromyces mariniharenae]
RGEHRRSRHDRRDVRGLAGDVGRRDAHDLRGGAVLVERRETEDLVADEPAAIAPASFDASIDSVGAGTPEWLYRAVRPRGRVITLQEAPDADLARAFDVDAQFFVVSPDAEHLGRLAALLSEGGIEVAVARTYPLSDGRAAYASRGTTGSPGKVVIDVSTSAP